MAISLGVVEKEYNQLFKERETLTESVNKLENELASTKSRLNALHGAVQVLEKLMRKADSDLTLREAEKELTPAVEEQQNG
jgi:cell division septum initiation protein DivIVA|tara:strand:+ start:143 stop:385 length:243 start_codon:yes stop_codon:yes gene_type:complete